MTPEVDAPMTLHARLEAAVRDAMRARDSRRTTTLRMALSAAHNQKIAKGRELTDEEVTEVLGREVKQRRESIAIYRDTGHDDRAAEEEAEAAILAEFLPEQMTDAEIEALARSAIDETGATGPADLGNVMGRLAPQTKGRADGRRVSEIVRSLLSGG
jgi:uncharacterized protein YqeY